MRSKLTILALVVVLLAAVFPLNGTAGGGAYMLGQRIGLLEADDATQDEQIRLLQKRVSCLEIRINHPRYRCAPLLSKVQQQQP